MCKDETLAKVKSMLELVVIEGTGKNAGSKYFTVAGKTGTAQQSRSRPNHALFIGYAPYDDPEIAIATRIAFGYTSHNAAEVSKDILAYYFGVSATEDLLNGEASVVSDSADEFTED